MPVPQFQIAQLDRNDPTDAVVPKKWTIPDVDLTPAALSWSSGRTRARRPRIPTPFARRRPHMLQSWLARPRTPNLHPRPRDWAHSRLRLEPLENRAVPATFTVNTGLDVVNPADGKLSLREAISRANTTTGADLIVLPAGVLKIATAGAGEDDNLNGDFDIADTVTIRGAGAGLTVIDGQQLDRVFEVIGTAPHSIEAVLQGVTVRNGNSAGNGGGIRVVDADMVVRDCAIIGNRAFGSGGGISANGAADLSLVRTTVARNVARGAGGGLHVEGELTMASGSV